MPELYFHHHTCQLKRLSDELTELRSKDTELKSQETDLIVQIKSDEVGRSSCGLFFLMVTANSKI